ncbi:hypothetical protein ABK040_011625 [Willaertia magna]
MISKRSFKLHSSLKKILNSCQEIMTFGNTSKSIFIIFLLFQITSIVLLIYYHSNQIQNKNSQIIKLKDETLSLQNQLQENLNKLENLNFETNLKEVQIQTQRDRVSELQDSLNSLQEKNNEISSQLQFKINEFSKLSEEFKITKKRSELIEKKSLQILKNKDSNKDLNKSSNKIAILISGAPRTLCTMISYFYSNVIQPNIVNDKYPSIFFTSTYREEWEFNCIEFFISTFKPYIAGHYYEKFSESETVKRFKYDSGFEIKKDTITPNYGMFFVQRNMTEGLLNYGNSLFLMYKANLLRKEYEKKTGEIHDIIIRIRSDILPEHPIPLIHFPIEEKTLYIGKAPNFEGYNDQFGFGDDFTMNLYFDVYKKLKTISETNQGHPHLRGIHPETILKHWLTDKNKVNAETVPIYFQIIRQITFRDPGLPATYMRLPEGNIAKDYCN